MPDPKLYLLFTAVTAIAILIQTGILLAVAISARETKKKVEHTLDEVRSKALPVLEQSRVILDDAAPKIRIITDNLVETTATLKKQATRVDGAVEDVLTRTRYEVARIDAMIGNTLDVVQSATHAVQHTVARASETLQHAVEVPTRRLSGVVNGVMAAVDRFRGAAPNGSRSKGVRYRKVPVTSADVAAAGRPVVQENMTEPLVPPAV
jgi:ABC-type transporter Mla subunit MlaD